MRYRTRRRCHRARTAANTRQVRSGLPAASAYPCAAQPLAAGEDGDVPHERPRSRRTRCCLGKLDAGCRTHARPLAACSGRLRRRTKGREHASDRSSQSGQRGEGGGGGSTEPERIVSSHRTNKPLRCTSPAARCLGCTRSLHAISAASRYLILHAPRRARSHTPRVHPIIHDSLNRMGDKRCEPVSSLPPCALQVSWIPWSEVYMSDSNNASESATPWQRSATVRPAPRTRMKNPTHRG